MDRNFGIKFRKHTCIVLCIGRGAVARHQCHKQTGVPLMARVEVLLKDSGLGVVNKPLISCSTSTPSLCVAVGLSVCRALSCCGAEASLCASSPMLLSRRCLQGGELLQC
jgi:hypothetical protein